MSALRLNPSRWPWAVWLAAPATAFAINSPQMTRQEQQDWVSEAKIAVGKIGAAAGPELTARTQQATSDPLGKLPRADKVHLKHMMFAAYRLALRGDGAMTEGAKARQILDYRRELQSNFKR
jgi:hypothetical protein